MSAAYPFSAIVGLADLRLALVLNAVSPAVGGVLVRGEKGTAKSTMVRALASQLPEVAVVPGCRFSCEPVRPDEHCPDGPHDPAVGGVSRAARLVELPVGASEDRLAGSLDIERALTEGVKAYEPGLLAAAHRGVLYVDEVNLLHDHLVDLLLDAAAMGTSHVEREGVSVRHAARFLLVGTMNPEEGELRPQLLDRFGLTVEVAASREPRERAEVVRRRLAYEADPDGFAARWADEDAALAGRILAARKVLADVRLPDAELERIARVCASFEVDGMRADLVTARTSIALAAWHGRTEVTAEDVRQAALLALPHRRRRNPFDAPGLDEALLDEALRDPEEPEPEPEPEPDGDGPDGGGEPPAGADGSQRSDGADRADGSDGADGSDRADGSGADGSKSTEATPSSAPGTEDAPVAGAPSASDGGREQAAVAAAEPYRTRLFAVPGVGQGAAGRRSRARTASGRTTGAQVAAGRVTRLHVAATVRAAALHQKARGRTGAGLLLRRTDLREAVREGREGNLVLFVVDASGSMAARKRMQAVKGAVLSLLLDAYQRRDKVGLVTFRGAGASLALPPTSSVEIGAARLAALPTGGRTPVGAGLLRAHETLRVERLRDPLRRPLLVVVTDGRATGGRDALGESRRAARLLAAGGVASLVVDCESGPVRLGLAARLAGDLGGPVVTLDELAGEGLAGLVRDVRSVA
ncbi:putative cobaltochelatase [Embleya sp. NPDC020630]|uniref:putative cobaltochelatase n=1 Tax=Embleya sp. NPDC020630 TaxID=3363979 RepID=UPI0037B81F1B